MAFDFDNLKNKAKELTNAGVSKAKELTEVGKLKVQNVSEQDDIRKAYMEIGKLYYARHKDAPEEEYAELFKKVADAQAKIDYNNERMADMKAAGNLTGEDAAGGSDD